MVAVFAAAVVLLLLLAPAAAADGAGAAPAQTTTFVPQELADAASAHPDQVFRVIVQAGSSTSFAGLKSGVNDTLVAAPATGDGVNGAFASISAVAAELTGEQIELLASMGTASAITPDMPVRASVADPPVALEPPVVNGTAAIGETLDASPGQWSPADVQVAYQWQRCDASSACSDIPGADTSSYAVADDDAGSALVVVVTATNPDGTASAPSTATDTVASPAAPPVQVFPPSTIVAPSVAGNAVVGETLRADDGVWSGAADLTRRWQRCDASGDPCADIVGATADTYTLVDDDAGSTVRILVTASDPFGAGLAASTASDVVTATTAPVPAVPAPTALSSPVITGAPITGELLSADDGTWSGLAEMTRQWQRCADDGTCVDIADATGSTYTLDAADTGFAVRFVVSATDAGGTTRVASEPTAVVAAPAVEPPPVDPSPQAPPPSPVVNPTLSGSAVVGGVLGVDEGTWSGGAISLAVQWQRCGNAGDGCVDLDGAVKPTYTITTDDVGSTLRADVIASDEFGVTAVPTPASDIVQALVTPTDGQDPPPPPTMVTPPSISGTTNVGETLTADDGEWTGITRLDRQWQRCNSSGAYCNDIGGETGPTYQLTSDDFGRTLRLEINTRTNTGRSTVFSDVTSVVGPRATSNTTSGSPGGSPAATGPASAPQNVTPPSIDSTPVVRTAIVATFGHWQTADDDRLRFLFRWQRCDASGANCEQIPTTGRTYTPADADAGSTLQVVVTAIDNDGRATSVQSNRSERVAPYSASGFWSWQLGPYAAKVDAAWDAVATANASLPAVAIVDSGVDSTLPGLDGSVKDSVSLTTLPQAAKADGYGHGSFVAQVVGGHAKGEAGAAPGAPIVSLDVMNDDGMALTSDVVAAADWIYTHKGADNIRVANFSLIGGTPSSIMFDPLDRALERLWLSGVVVVTAAGNFAADGVKSDEPFSPANDPFAITVGAADTAGTLTTDDDFPAPWSAFGHSLDGFAKPELGAPGRYVVASVPTDSTLYTQRADRIVGDGQLSLSGTSFAAPLVAGIAADLLALHPTWKPDDVKGALMLTAKQPTAAGNWSLGVGEVDAAAALAVTDPPNPNEALEQFVGPDPAGGTTPVLDTASWGTAAQANASWGTASWGTASWGTASWGTASWGTDYWSSASWGTASWGTASWGTASWGTASWGTASWGTDYAKADVLPAGSYWMRWG